MKGDTTVIDTTGDRGGFTIAGDDGIAFFQLARLKGMVKMELHGMKMSHGFSAYADAKRRYNLSGSKASVSAQLEKMVDDAMNSRGLKLPE